MRFLSTKAYARPKMNAARKLMRDVTTKVRSATVLHKTDTPAPSDAKAGPTIAVSLAGTCPARHVAPLTPLPQTTTCALRTTR